MDIKMGANGKGLFFENGKFALTEDMLESLAQRLSIKLKTVLGSWYLNVNYGIDYFNRVFEKAITQLSIDTMFQTEITKEMYVDRITYFKSKIENREYILEFKVLYRSGEMSDTITILVNESGKAVISEAGIAIRIK